MSESVVSPLVDKWKPLLDGVDDKVTAMLLANMQALFKEQDKTKKPSWPQISSSWPAIENIVSVQPMTHPVGGIQFYQPRYGSFPSDPKTKLHQRYLFDDPTL